jgi:hypothetical protein
LATIHGRFLHKETNDESNEQSSSHAS